MEIKPLRKTSAVPLLQEIRAAGESRFAADALLERCAVVTEGEVEVAEGSAPSFSGSVMLRMELDRPGLFLPLSDEGKKLLLGALRRSIPFHVRLMRLARKEAERMSAPRLLRGMGTELEFKIEGSVLFVDIELECKLAEHDPVVDDASRESL